MPNRVSTIVIATIAFVSATASIRGQSPSGNEWSQWRGPHRDGQVVGVTWPMDLSEQHLSEKWTVPLGPSYSGPIVSQDRVFVTETKDDKFEVVVLDRSGPKARIARLHGHGHSAWAVGIRFARADRQTLRRWYDQCAG